MKPRVLRLGSDKNGVFGSASFQSVRKSW